MLKRALQHSYIAEGSKWNKKDVERSIALVDANAVSRASAVLRLLRGMHSFSPKAEMELIQGLARQLRQEGFRVALHTATYETVREQACEIARKRFYALRRKAGVKAARFRRGAVQECLRKIKAYASSDDDSDADDDGDDGVGAGKSNAASREDGGGGGKSKASRRAKVIEKRSRRLKQYLVGFTIVPPNAVGSDALACFEPVRSLDAASMREEAGGVRVHCLAHTIFAHAVVGDLHLCTICCTLSVFVCR